jgi:hypothetical protein
MNEMRAKLVLGQLRTLLAFVAGILVTNGWLEEQYADEAVAIALYALVAAGSWLDKTGAKSGDTQ